MVRLGKAGRGGARSGQAWQGNTRPGAVSGTIFQGLVRHGGARPGEARSGLDWHGRVRMGNATTLSGVR